MTDALEPTIVRAVFETSTTSMARANATSPLLGLETVASTLLFTFSVMLLASDTLPAVASVAVLPSTT